MAVKDGAGPRPVAQSAKRNRQETPNRDFTREGTPSQGSNTMAVKDGAGPRPVAQSAKRYFLNRQETEVQTVTLPATAAVQAGVQGPCRRAKTPWQ